MYSGYKGAKAQKEVAKEARKTSEQELQKQEQKQKDLQRTYKGMKTNLYSTDINGVNSSQLIQ